MNQILMTEKKKKQKSTGRAIEIKGIVRFFAIAIFILGLVCVGEGSYAIYQDVDSKKPANIPLVTLARVNDKAIIKVEHNVEISKIIYYWDDGEQTVIPEGTLTAQEEILLPNQDSTLYIVVEDSNGKQVNYQKQYILEGVDITKPTIEVKTENGSDKMIITAKDETEILYLSYQWNNEEPIIIDAETEGQKEIIKDLTIAKGSNKIKIIAEDTNGNVEQIEKEVIVSSKPTINLSQDKENLIIDIADKDGIKDITININGKEYKGTNMNRNQVKLGPFKLQEGNNTIQITVSNVNGYTGSGTTELQYTP